MNLPRAAWLLVLSLVPLLSACGVPAVNVEGKVTLDGQPLTTGQVAYHPAGSKGENDSVVGHGSIDAQGNYKLFTAGRAGVPAGAYSVVVTAGAPSKPNDPYSVPVSLVDKKYTRPETTPLTVEVASGNSPDKYNLSLTK
jgi:hypothetical protein